MRSRRGQRVRSVLATLLAVVTSVLTVSAPSPASAAIGDSTSYAADASGPDGITLGPDGAMWFANSGNDTIGWIRTGGTFGSFGDAGIHTPTDVAAGPDGALWFTNSTGASIGRITTTGTVTSFPLAPGSTPMRITAGPDGALWYLDPGTKVVGRITTGGAVTTFADPGLADPSDITTGPDGALWYTEAGPLCDKILGCSGSFVGRITTGGTINHFAGFNGFEGVSWRATGIAPTPADDLIVVTQSYSSGAAFRVSTAGAFTPIDPFTGDPTTRPGCFGGAATAPDGTVWLISHVCQTGSAAAFAPLIGVRPDASFAYLYGLLGAAQDAIAVGDDGAVWYPLLGDEIGRTVVAEAPGAPVATGAVAGMGSATVTWTAPADDGGAHISVYTVTSSPEGATCTWTGGPLSCVVTGLTPGVDATFTVTATNWVGTGPASNSVGPVTPRTGARFHPLTPFRVWDSRSGPGTVGKIGPGASVAVPIAGQGTIPPTAGAVVLNVTATGGTANSYLSAFPTGRPVPPTANLLFAAGATVSNLVTIGIGDSGDVSFFNQLGNVDVVADVLGYYDDGTGPGDRFTPTTPARLLDSRTDVGGWNDTPLGAGEAREITVRGAAGVPVDATAVVVNVTATDPLQASYLQLWPTGQTQPTTANLLFAKGETIPNLAVVALGADGKISVFNQLSQVDVVADVIGYFTPTGGARFYPTPPTRLLDSRDAGPAPWTAVPLGANQARSLAVAGTHGIPTGATAIAANVTATQGTIPSYLTISPTPATVPAPTANLLFAGGQTIPNAVVTGLGGGALDAYNQQGAVHLVIDAAGYFAP